MILADRDSSDRYVTAGVWGKVPLDGILARNAQARPDDIALIDRGDRIGWQRAFPTELTWNRLDQMVSALAAVFLDSGLRQDDVVAVQLGNTAETLITHLALLRGGMIPAALPLTWRERELKSAFERLAPVALVTATRIGPNDHTDIMMRAASETMSVRRVFAFGDRMPDGVQALNGALAPDAPTEGGDGLPRTGNPADHVAILTFASWEGRLEPIARSHNQWLTAAMETVFDARIGPDASVATTLLPSSLAGLACGLAAWMLSGCKLILVMPQTSAAFCREIGRLAATHLVMPGHLTHLAAQLDPDHRMRLIRYWASPESFAPADGLIAADPTMTDVVSLDEMAITAASGRKALVLPVAAMAGSQDDPREPDPKEALLTARMPGTMFRPGGKLVPGALMSGALLLGGPQIPTAGFPVRGDETELSFRFKPHPEGFRESGLRCRLTNDNGPVLAVQGHRKETFVTGGLAIAAESLDEVFRGYDGFLDAAAASVADPLFGERVVAAVVPRPGGDCSLAAFRAYLRELGVAPHMVPERIIAVLEIPRASDGGVLRSAISTGLAA